MSRYLIYVGCYAPESEEGIQLISLDLHTGELAYCSGASGVENPSFLTLSKDQRFLYAVSEVAEFQGVSGGGVVSFAVSENGQHLTRLNAQPTQGDAPCHLCLDAQEQSLHVANYGGGNVCSYGIAADGTLTEPRSFHQHEGQSANPDRQEGPHAHMVHVLPDSRHLAVSDLGIDQLRLYRIEPEGALTPLPERSVPVPAGEGPRHLTFSASGKTLYLINELGNTVLVYPMGADGFPEQEFVQLIRTLPEEFSGESYTADLHVHPNGQFLYGSNRGHNSLVCFRILPDEQLEWVGVEPTGGHFPRNFALDPSGRWLVVANQETGNLLSFAVDGTSGALTRTHELQIRNKPVCLQFGTLLS